VIAGGFAAWYYQEPIRQFASDLATEVEAQMNRETPVATNATAPAGAPLARAPTVTDEAPAMVLAPGATLPATTEPEQAAPQASDESARPPAADANAPASSSAPASSEMPPVAAATPGPTRFEFVQPSISVREGDVAARVTIRRSGDLSKPAEVSWWTQGGTAVADEDYADLGARVERFAPGEASRTVYVPLTNDSVREPVKCFTVVLGRGQGEIIARARVDIADDD